MNSGIEKKLELRRSIVISAEPNQGSTAGFFALYVSLDFSITRDWQISIAK